MASGFFSILDDIAALMDDVAVTSKIATKQTAGILGDDLAVNAEKATGFLASREIPVLLQIMKGSFINKIIIIPIVFLLQFFYPLAIKIILIIGGLYLAYEGMEKIIHYFLDRKNKKGQEIIKENTQDENHEKEKIKSAILTDFILSIEIIIIALSTVLDKSFTLQILTVAVVSIIATVGVYGIVALIVKIDDLGYNIVKKSKGNQIITKIGEGLIQSLPLIIKALSVIGTIALLLVSGGIFSHNIDYFHHHLNQFPSMVKDLILGIIAGSVVFLIISGGKKIFNLSKK